MRLMITRSEQQLTDLAHRAAARGIEIQPLPLIEFEPVTFDWPPLTRNERVDWIAFTSANGVETFFATLADQYQDLDSAIKLAVIGSRTESALRAAGHSPDYVASQAYGETLFRELASGIVHPGYTLVYARPESVSFDPEAVLDEAAIEYIPLICYRTRQEQVDPKLVDGLSGDDYILFTAPSTVYSYHRQFGCPTATPIAIGETTGSAMRACGWEATKALPRPDIDSVLETVA